MTGDGSYCTLQEVADRLKNIVINNDTDASVTTGPFAYNAYPNAVLKTSQVSTYIGEVEPRVLDKIAQKYAVPITLAASPKAHKRVREIVRGYVIGQCYPILKLSGRAMEGPDEQKNVMSAYGTAKSFLTEILDDSAPFTDATRLVSIEDSTDSAEPGDGETTYQKFDPRTESPPW